MLYEIISSCCFKRIYRGSKRFLVDRYFNVVIIIIKHTSSVSEIFYLNCGVIKPPIYCMLCLKIFFYWTLSHTRNFSLIASTTNQDPLLLMNCFIRSYPYSLVFNHHSSTIIPIYLRTLQHYLFSIGSSLLVITSWITNLAISFYQFHDEYKSPLLSKTFVHSWKNWLICDLQIILKYLINQLAPKEQPCSTPANPYEQHG